MMNNNLVLKVKKCLRIEPVMVLALTVLVTTSCGDKEFRLTQEQVEERIKKELPIGATQEQVKQFISYFKSEFDVDERVYEAKTPTITPESVGDGSTDVPYHGIIRARIRKIGRDPKIFAVFDLHLEFYFDEKGLLSGHKPKTYGYH